MSGSVTQTKKIVLISLRKNQSPRIIDLNRVDPLAQALGVLEDQGHEILPLYICGLIIKLLLKKSIHQYRLGLIT